MAPGFLLILRTFKKSESLCYVNLSEKNYPFVSYNKKMTVTHDLMLTSRPRALRPHVFSLGVIQTK